MALLKNSIVQKGIDLLYPRVCPVCGEILTEKRQQQLKAAGVNPYICPECLPLLHFAEGRRCLICSRPLENEEDDLCSDCSRKKRYFDSGYALMLHADEEKRIIYDIKYRGIKDYTHFLAEECARRGGRTIRVWQPEVLIPVPLHRSKQKARGFNQSEVFAALLARELESQLQLSIPVDTGYIIRSRKTPPQKELEPEERASNVRGAFELAKGAESGRYKTAAIIDDIFTTGATINEIAKLLRKNGVENIYFVTCSIVG